MSRKRLLIIDGDENFVQEVVDFGERLGIEVITSSSSVEGLELASSHAPDLVVVNVELSPTNGWSVCTKLKKDEQLNHIPVVLTSADSTTDTFEKHRKLRTRAEEYLLKPYAPSDLLEIAGGLLGLPSLTEPLVHVDESFDAETFDTEGFDDEGFDDYVLEDESEAGGDLPATETVDFDDVDDTDDGGFGGLEDEPDPLAANADDIDWASDPLEDPLTSEFGDEEVVAFDEPAEPASEQPQAFEALEDFSRGGFETSEFSAGALAQGDGDFNTESEAADIEVDDIEVDDIQLEDEFQVDDDIQVDDGFDLDDDLQLDDGADAPLQTDAAVQLDEWEDEEVDPLGGFDGDSSLDEEFTPVEQSSDETLETAELVPFEDATYDEADALEDDSATLGDNDASLDEFTYDEAPLEVPVETAGGQGSEEFDDELVGSLDDGDFDLDGSGLGLSGDDLGGEDLARIGELEAQLDGLRAVDATREAELVRLRDELANRDQRLRDLQSQLDAKDRTLQESNARNEAEKTRREATLKSLTARSEQLVAAVRKGEREITSLRSNAARVGELEAELATAHEQIAELESVRSQLSQAQEELKTQQASLEAVEEAKTQAEAQVEELKTESDALRADLDETRHVGERALENAGQLQDKLADASERVLTAQARVEALESANSAARDALLHLVEELGTA